MYVQSLDNALGGTVKEFYVRVYYDSSKPRDYHFNITFVANTAPTFSSTQSDLILNWDYDATIELPLATDAEGDSIEYELITPSSVNFTHTISSTNSLEISSIDWDLSGVHSGYIWRAKETVTNGFFKDELTFSITINAVPKVSINS